MSLPALAPLPTVLLALALPLALPATLGCSSTHDFGKGGTGAAASTDPGACDKGRVSGTYDVVYTKVSGTCGVVERRKIAISPDDPTGAEANTCTVLSDTWSNQDCQYDVTSTCDTSGVTVHQTGSY